MRKNRRRDRERKLLNTYKGIEEEKEEEEEEKENEEWS